MEYAGNSRKDTEAYLDATLSVKKGEDIPVKITDKVRAHPLLNRYFVKVRPDKMAETGATTEDDFIVTVGGKTLTR